MISHLVDLVGLIYDIFHKEKFDLCWKNKYREEGRRRSRTMNLERFCCVLPLLVETSGRLILPFKMMSNSSKKLLWLAKVACNACSISKIQIALEPLKLCIFMT